MIHTNRENRLALYLRQLKREKYLLSVTSLTNRQPH